MPEPLDSKPPIQSKDSRAGNTLRHLAKNPLIRPPILALLSMVDSDSYQEIVPNSDILIELQHTQGERYDLFQRWKQNMEEKMGHKRTINISGLLPWLKDTQHLVALGSIDCYEPYSQLLLPEKADDGKIGYNSISIKSLFTPKPLKNEILQSFISGVDTPYVSSNEIPPNDQYRASIDIHAHPSPNAPINDIDLSALVLFPELLGRFVYAKDYIYGAFITDKTPLFELNSLSQELAHGRTVFPRHKMVSLKRDLENCVLQATARSAKESFVYQWGEARHFCERYNIDLFVGEVNLKRDTSLRLYDSKSVHLTSLR